MFKSAEQLRQEASTPEFMKMYSAAVTEGMSGRGTSQCDSDLYDTYIQYCLGQAPWRPEFAQFAPRQGGY